MNCPKCGLAHSLAERVCRRCKYFFEEDRYLSIEPPRSGRPVPDPARRSLDFPAVAERLASRAWVVYTAALIPGLGHMLSGNRKRGWIYCALSIGLMILSILLFSGTAGQILFGLAVSIHAYSIFELTPWSRVAEPLHRIVAMGVLLLGLQLIYWPLMVFLANRLVASRRVERESSGSFPGFSPRWVAVALLVALIFWASRAASRFRWLKRRT